MDCELNLGAKDEHDIYMDETRQNETKRVEPSVHKHQEVILGLCYHLPAVVLSLHEWHPDYLCGTPFPADFYFNSRSLLGERILNIAHCDVLPEGW